MAIESVMHEKRVFNPPKKLSENAYIKNLEQYQQLCDKSKTDYEGYWADLAKNLIVWKKPFTKILNEDNAPFYTWFDDGELNVSYNCIDRHLPSKKDKWLLSLSQMMVKQRKLHTNNFMKKFVSLLMV